MLTLDFDADTLRTLLHLIGVVIWLGGQIVVLGLLPTLRRIGGDVPKQIAQAHARVAWPAFGLLVVTGIWNILAIDLGEVSTGYNAGFGIKMILVVVTGGAAWVHQRTDTPAIKGITGALGFGAALGAFVIGAAMAN